MVDELLPGFEPAPIPEPMSAGRRTTQKRRELIAKGIHPATGLPIIKDDDRTCGSCTNLLRKENPAAFAGTFWKCALALDASHHGPDIRKKWPACTSHKAGEKP